MTDVLITHEFEGITFGRAHQQMLDWLDQKTGNPRCRWMDYRIKNFVSKGRQQRFTLEIDWMVTEDRVTVNRDSDAGRAATEICMAASRRLNPEDDRLGPVINLLWKGRIK